MEYSLTASENREDMALPKKLTGVFCNFGHVGTPERG